MFICVHEDGRVTVDGIEAEPGWDKGWIFENVYGWTWHGPFRFDNYQHLLVLRYEPDATERAEIEERYKDATPPYGEPEFRIPTKEPQK